MNNSWSNDHWQQNMAPPPHLMQHGMPHMHQGMQHRPPPPQRNEYGNMQIPPDFMPMPPVNMGKMPPGNMPNMPGNMSNMPNMPGNMPNMPGYMMPEYGNMPPDFGNMQGMQPPPMSANLSGPPPPPGPLQPPNFLLSSMNIPPPAPLGPPNVPPVNDAPLIGPVWSQDENQHNLNQENNANSGEGAQDMVLDVDAADPDVEVIGASGATDGNKQKEENDRDGRRRDKDRGGRDRRDDRGRDRDRERERDRDKNRSGRRGNDRDRNDRGDRNRSRDRDRSNRSRERRSKWSTDDDKPKVLMPGMPGYGMPIQPPAMPNTLHPGLNNMNMMQNNMVGNMLPNMGNMPPNMMLNPMQVIIPNQPIYVTNAMVLPPVPGTQLPNRREKPMGCRTIFVGGLPTGLSNSTVHELFVRFGGITEVKLRPNGVCHIRFDRMESVELSFVLAGYRFKRNDQMEAEATTLFIDYALNREDFFEYEKKRIHDGPTPPPVEHCNLQALDHMEKTIKEDEKFPEVSYTLGVWLERGEVNKKNAANFYKLIQTCNNHVRRLFSEKMTVDEEFQTLKNASKQKFANIVLQFEQVAKILTAAKVQRVWDHFTRQQRKNIETWHKMTEEVEVIKEEFNATFNEDEIDVSGRSLAISQKYELLKSENEALIDELEGYKNEAHLAKDEAERKFEKFKAQFVAQQALHGKNIPFAPPLPPSPNQQYSNVKPQPPPPTPDDNKIITSGPPVPPTEAKLISILTVFLMVHPLGASLEYLVSYVRSMVPNVTQATVHQVLRKYGEVFRCESSGYGNNMEQRWCFVTFDLIKSEA